jgi:hypothetical protein
VLLTGWAAGDTHGGVSNFVTGRQLVLGHAVYNNLHAHTPGLRKHPAKEFGTFRMGFRFRLRTKTIRSSNDLEFIRSTNNTWASGSAKKG